MQQYVPDAGTQNPSPMPSTCSMPGVHAKASNRIPGNRGGIIEALMVTNCGRDELSDTWYVTACMLAVHE